MNEPNEKKRTNEWKKGRACAKLSLNITLKQHSKVCLQGK